MNHFDAKTMAKRMSDFALAECSFRDATRNGGDVEPRPLTEFTKALARCIDGMSAVGIEGADVLKNIIREVNVPEVPVAAALEAYAKTARHTLRDGLKNRKFLYVPNDLVKYLDNERLFGDLVWEKFPSARADVQEAGNCLAAGCETAAVFHAMRVVEWGLRALATHLGVRRLKSYRKNGTAKLTPVAYSQWETILNGLGKRIEKRLKKLRPGPLKQEREQFYNEAVEEINAIRQAWRNHVMHSRNKVIREDAVAVLGHASRLMAKLATRVSEV